MLLVENLPQPSGLISSGEASARESRLQCQVSRRLQCRTVTAALSGRLKPLIHV
jgi:hypothetical protein